MKAPAETSVRLAAAPLATAIAAEGVAGALRRRMPLLFWAAAANATLAAGLALLWCFDDRQVLGIERWIKPWKFATSIALYLLTLAWYLAELPAGARRIRQITRATVICMAVEIICIAGQSARGVPSHFNTHTPFDLVVFAVMGIAIALNTFLAGAILWLYFSPSAALPATYLWGLRLGLVLFMGGSLEGGVMVGLMAHTVGAPDGGPGLPVMNWSTQAGDLRIAHFLGLHALQVLPLAGWILAKAGERRGWGRPERLVWLFAAAYGIVCTAIMAQALLGRPLFSLP